MHFWTRSLHWKRWARAWDEKIPRGYPGGEGGGVLRISRDRSSKLLFQRLLSIVYTTLLIQPQFDYIDIVWGNCGKTFFDRLQKLQNRSARVLTFSRYDAHANRLFKQLNWKDLSTQFQIQKALMVHKSLRACLHGVGDPGVVGLVSFVFTLWGTQNKRNLPHYTGVPHSM